jgi:transposase
MERASEAWRYRKSMDEMKPQEKRVGPFDEVWDKVKAMLEADSGLEAKTIMEFLMEEYPGRFQLGQLRTLQRLVRTWRVTEGPDKEVYFRQVAEPGRQSQSDFTNCDKLKVTINGEPFRHLLFHFMLPYSRWETCEIAFSESFASLTKGYAKAVKELGGCAKEHRTDNLAAAVHVNEHGEAQFNEKWIQFLDHYGIKPSRSKAYRSNENGSVEKSHDLLKRAIKQRLKLRKSLEFSSQELYESFIKGVVNRLNQSRQKRLVEEKEKLKALPKHEWSDVHEVSPQVTAFSTITVCKAVYSVPSRLIGVELKALVLADAIKVYYGSKLVQEMPKLLAGGRKINYRHLIASLVRKPGAFARYQYRDELFPGVIFRRAYDTLQQKCPASADREYLQILYLAAMVSENEVIAALEILVEEGQGLSSAAVRSLVETRREAPSVSIQTPSLSVYDLLLSNPDALRLKEIPNEQRSAEAE